MLMTDTRNRRGGLPGRRTSGFWGLALRFLVFLAAVLLTATAGFGDSGLGFTGVASAGVNPRLGFGRVQYGQYSAALGTSVPHRGQVNAMSFSSEIGQ
jgi:hypothetical protein